MSDVLAPFTVHVAGAPVGLVQSCVACGFVLQDNTAWAEGRVAVMEGDTAGPMWWPVGERIGTDKTPTSRGGITFVVEEGRELDADERLCAGAN